MARIVTVNDESRSMCLIVSEIETVRSSLVVTRAESAETGAEISANIEVVINKNVSPSPRAVFVLPIDFIRTLLKSYFISIPIIANREFTYLYCHEP